MVKSLTVIILFLLSIQVTAEDSKQKPATNKTLERRFIEANKNVSGWIDSYADKLDIYLSGKRISNRLNRTTVVLRNVSSFVEYDKDTNLTYFDIKLRLPNFEESWQLRFTSYDEDEEEVGVNAARLQPTATKENYGASVAWFKKLGDIDVSFKPRLKLKDEVETSYVLRLTSDGDFGWILINPRFEFFARHELGTGQFFSLPMIVPLSDKWSFLFTNEEQYSDAKNLFNTNHDIGFVHSLNDSMDIKFAVLYENNNKPVYRLQQYTAYLAFTHRLYRQVVHYNFVPKVEYLRTRQFSPRLGLLFDVRFIF